MSTGNLGPVLFAYDGSDLASLAIEEAGRQLEPGREAVVLTVWRPYAVGFIPARQVRFDAARARRSEKLPRKPPRKEPRLRKPPASAPTVSRSRKHQRGRGSPASLTTTTRA